MTCPQPRNNSSSARSGKARAAIVLTQLIRLSRNKFRKKKNYVQMNNIINPAISSETLSEPNQTASNEQRTNKPTMNAVRRSPVVDC